MIRQIAIAVIMAHLFLLCMLGADHWMHRPKEKRKIAVHTIAYEKPVVEARSVAITPKRTPTVKKLNAKPVPKASIATDALCREIAKNLDALAPMTPVKRTTLVVPELNIRESSAAEQIATLLQESLELPEFGSVKARLTIDAKGTLEELIILDTKSQKNEQFLKKRLPELQFPCLNTKTTLTIVFSNAR